MTFGQPLWFWAFALLPLLLLLYVRHERRRVKLLRQLVAARLLDRLAGSVSLGRRRLRFATILLGLSALIISLSQPRYGYTWEESKRKGRDVIIAIDCSKSMLATDISPSRLERAKMAVQDLVGQFQGDRVGLIAFAGTAFLQAPLTIDYGAVLNSLSEFDTNIIPRGGTNIAAAITEADAAFGKGESDNRCLILFTDGEELEDDSVTAANAEKDHMKIFTVGVGSADGSLIPVPDEHGGTTFAKDESGQFVKSRLDEDRLRKIAESAGGFYVHLQNGPAEMQHIVRDGLGQMKEQEIDTRMSRRPIERYEWPLAAAIVLLVVSTLIGERKTVARAKGLSTAPARAGAVLLLLILPVVAHAKNSGLEAYDHEDYKGAMSEFDRQLQEQKDSAALNFDLGAAAYKSADFPKALDAFSKATTSPDPALHSAAEYNLGNTLFEQGVRLEDKDQKIRELKDALTHYEQALKVVPQNKDAEYNRDVVRRLLEELQKQPPKSDQKQQQKQQNKKDDQQDQKNQQNQQQQQSKGGKSDQDQQQQQGQSQQQQQKDQQQQSQSQQNQSQSQQAQNQQSQSQQSQGGGQSQQQQSQGQQPKDQQQQGSQEQKQQASNKPDGKEGQQNSQPEQKNGNEDQKQQADPSQGGQQLPQQQQAQGQPLKPMPDDSGKKRDGQIQAQASPQSSDTKKEEAAEAEAAKEGKMTAAQARSLLESLRDEDEHVQLLKPPGKPRGQNFRDW
jgi:Ca-activated chloride channel family protein